MSAQDILLMLRHQVLDAYSKVQTRTVVAVDVRKAYDTVPHEAVVQSSEPAGVCGHLLNFVASFLNDRMYKIKAGDYIRPAQPNRTGVQQGAVLSPTLFNLVMARIPSLFEAVPSLHFAVYADDVTMWVTTGSAGEQEHAFQLGLDVIEGFLRNLGMNASAEKTEYVVVLNGPHRKNEAVRNQIALSMAGQRIWRNSSIRISGAFIDQDGKGTTWCRSLLRLIRRITHFQWGTRERETRQLVTALLESRILYGYNYRVLKPRQAEQLKKLNPEAIRIVTGLPKHTPLRELYAHGGMNLLSELAEQALLAQRDRLSSSTAALSILEELRVSPSLDVRPADAHSPPLWAAPVTLTERKPLPRNMGPGPSSSGFTHKSPPTHTIIYTDMAELAVDCQRRRRRRRQNSQARPGGRVKEVDATQAELMPLLRASQWVLQTFAPTGIPHRLLLFTDSTGVYETCRRASGSPSTYTGIVGELLAAFLELQNKLNVQATISWVPAHAGIDGNEGAHSEARAAVRQMASAPNAFYNSAGEAAGPADPSAFKESAKQRRRRTLRHLREEGKESPDEQLRSVPPMPNDLPRSTQTLVCRLATNTVLSPAQRHQFFSDDPDKGAYRRCRRTATAAHVVWECERHARLRKTKLEELPDGIRPATYVDWILPTSRDKAIVSLLWTKLAEFVYDDDGPGGRLCCSRRR
ncbi:hypothetical protein HPB47_006300 [Ixodes persulcatus]|uniref:Uncharacterized protein n=1 Tax=Ixodes persulcatus TaxID=34615 RepID=A0AC60PBM2_IXOPE|nr:hypothetical protein HPB47_006300 [Ixodes persulcatus]